MPHYASPWKEPKEAMMTPGLLRFLVRVPPLMAVGFVTVTSPPSLYAVVPGHEVEIALANVSAQSGDGEILFRCEAVISNNTGGELTVKSRFYSAFDGLSVAVFDRDGKKLCKQSYLDHQSPTAEERTFPLKQGENRKSLGFPIRDLPRNVETVRVLLVGTLPGSAYQGVVLLSDLVEVTVKAARLPGDKPGGAVKGDVAPMAPTRARLPLPEWLSEALRRAEELDEAGRVPAALATYRETLLRLEWELEKKAIELRALDEGTRTIRERIRDRIEQLEKKLPKARPSVRPAVPPVTPGVPPAVPRTFAGSAPVSPYEDQDGKLEELIRAVQELRQEVRAMRGSLSPARPAEPKK
jgi:hypothetical protein